MDKDVQRKFDTQNGHGNNNDLVKIGVNQNSKLSPVSGNPKGVELDSDVSMYTSFVSKYHPFVRSVSEGMVLFKEKPCHKCT